MRKRGSLSRRVRVAATLATIMLVIAGCGGGSRSTPGNEACPPAPGVTPTQVDFGLLFPASGLGAGAYLPYRAGVDARLGTADERGGVFGREIRYTWADDGGSESTNLTQARRLVTQDNVFAVQELSASPRGSAAWLNQQGVPVVGTADDLVWTRYRNMFSYFNLITGNGSSVTTWGDYARSQGVGKAAILVTPVVQGSVAFGDEVSKSMRAAGIATETILVDTANINIQAIVDRVRASGANLLSGVLTPDTFFQTAVAVRDALPTIKILSVNGYDAAVLAAGRRLAGMSVFTGYLPFETPNPALKTFLDAMSLYSPQLQQPANELALTGWIDTDLLLRGLQAAGSCPTRQSFMTGLRKVTDYSAGGLLTYPVNMDTVFGQLTLCYSFMKISPDGTKFVPVGDKPLCGQRIH
jgi:ABC-type branched-subunit amino acid transport system substrate-binding protein